MYIKSFPLHGKPNSVILWKSIEKTAPDLNAVMTNGSIRNTINEIVEEV